MSKWKEIKKGFIDDAEHVVCIDAWKSADENEEGKVIAKVDLLTKEVTYLDKTAKTDLYAQTVIKEAVAELEAENPVIPAILVERDYKGSYERFALTPEEFAKEFPETYKNFGPVEESNSDTLKPLVHIWFEPCKVGDEKWQRHFTDMEWGLPESDIENGNLAYIREDLFQSLKKYLPDEVMVNKIIERVKHLEATELNSDEEIEVDVNESTNMISISRCKKEDGRCVSVEDFCSVDDVNVKKLSEALLNNNILCDLSEVFENNAEEQENTRFNYLYRDAGNYKVYNSVVVAGKITDEQEEKIMNSLNDATWFIPAKVGLPAERFKTFEPEADHYWFELQDVPFVSTKDAPTVGLTIAELAEAFDKCKDSWEVGIDMFGNLIPEKTAEAEKKPSLFEQIQKAEAKTPVAEAFETLSVKEILENVSDELQRARDRIKEIGEFEDKAITADEELVADIDKSIERLSELAGLDLRTEIER